MEEDVEGQVVSETLKRKVKYRFKVLLRSTADEVYVIARMTRKSDGTTSCKFKVSESERRVSVWQEGCGWVLVLDHATGHSKTFSWKELAKQALRVGTW